MKIPNDMTTGTVHKTRNNGDLMIISYKSALSVEVRFVKTGFVTTTSSRQIRTGQVKDYLKPCVFGVGYFGVGSYKAKESGKQTKAYETWSSMLCRCYSDDYHKRNPAYIGCSVCEEWHNFQVFAKWHEENYPTDGGRYQLDKDIKIEGNRVYSPSACMFVTHKQNVVKSQAKHYKFTSTDGNIVHVYNLKEFCDANNLSHGTMSSVFHGKRKSYKGWRKA